MEVSVGLRAFNNWQDVMDSALARDIDPSTAAIQSDGTITGLETTTGQFVMFGVWNGNATLGTQAGGSITSQPLTPPANIPGILGLHPNVSLPRLGNVPWWLWLVLAGAVVIVLRD